MRTPVFFDEQIDDKDTTSTPASSSGSSIDDSHLFPTPPASNLTDSSMPNDAVDKGDWRIQDQDSGIWPRRCAGDDSSSVSENMEGVLILSGDEGDEAPTPNTSPRRTLIFTHLYQTALDLSIPGTDSLPSDIGSIDAIFRPANQKTEAIEQSRSERPRRGKAENQTGGMSASKVPFSKSLVVSAVTACILVIVIIYLYLDRNSWRERASQLDQELAETITQLVEARNQSKIVMGIVSNNLGRSDNDTWTTKDEFDWENEGVGAAEQVVLAENCWFKATLQLGDCASNAKDCVNDLTKSMISSFSGFGKTLYSNSAMAASRPIQVAGASLEALNEASYLIASATVATADSMRAAFSAADKAVLYAVEQTRDAIQDASVALDVDMG